jgi:hypothetical protein
MTNDTTPTTFVYDVIATAPAPDVEQTEATPPGASVPAPMSAGDDADLRLDGLDSNDVPGGEETSLGTATVTLPSGEVSAEHVVLGQGAGAVTVDFVDVPPEAG